MNYETMSRDEMTSMALNNPELFNDREFCEEYSRKTEEYSRKSEENSLDELIQSEIEAEKKALILCQTRAALHGITLQEYISMKLLMNFELDAHPYLKKQPLELKKQSLKLEYIAELLKLIIYKK